MNAERWQKIKNLFDAAQEIAPEKRRDFFDGVCGSDAENLRVEVEKLLESLNAAQSFMENPAAAEVADMFENKQTTPVAHNLTGERPDEKFVAGTILASRYRIIGLLGRGGMGEVYKAEDIKLDQMVALKFLPDKLEKDAAALNHFISEVRMARQIAHANVCRVFDISEINGRHFISMEYVDGDDLSSLLRRIGRLPSERAVEIARQLCVGLHAIHDAKILHRDFKPANIIIDSKGKVRITDFGVAGFVEDVSRENLRMGTPAYMSPEQITGGKISQTSDIYALGLVLYEIFTGKQAFTADSVLDLIRKNRDETPTNPSDYVKDIDPLVEKVIFQCLEKNPLDRPPSALYVAMALPGGNPLQVAIEAGKTPSPEMVAAAPKKGALRPAVSAVLLAGILTAFAAAALMSKRTHLHRQIPLEKSAEVLREKSRELAEKFGYKGFDSDSAFLRKWDYLNYLRDNDDSLTRWQKLAGGQPAVLQFWYRQSPQPLAPQANIIVSPDDPPNIVPEMAQVKLDTKARLIFFDGVPPQNDSAGTATKIFEWESVFRDAGFNLSAFRETLPEWTPPHAFDERRAWTGVYPEREDIPIRVEAAAYRGKLICFQIVEPWDKSLSESFEQDKAGFSFGILISVFFGVLAISAFFAIRNSRAGRSDLRGTFRLTLFLFVLRMALWLFAAHHVAASEEVMMLIAGLQSAVFWACFAGMMYLAFEPYLRRHTPERVISWNRLLAGDWRDPLVGRDILIGIFAGLTAIVLFGLRGFLPVRLGDPPAMPFLMSNPYGSMLAGIRGFPVLFLSQINASPVQAFMVSFVVLFFTVLLRRKWLGALAAWLLFFAYAVSTDVAEGVPVAGMTFAVVFPTLMVLMTTRFGVLALMAAFLTYHLVIFYPITTELSAWYASDFLMVAGFLLALAIYGFYVSLAGQKIFQGQFLADAG